MQSGASEHTNAEATSFPEDEPEIQGHDARMAEEFRMLMMGFGTGLTIAGIFLIYLVLEYAKLLP